MSVGEANGIPFTSKDLDGIAIAFDALGLSGRVPLKFGHPPDEDQPFREGMPALGWIARVFRVGEKLKGDLTDMPTAVYDAVKAGLYKFISVELLKNVQAGTRVIPWVLDAVALLGADQPAFGNLQDLQSLTLKRKPAFQARARVAFRRDKFTFTGAQKGMDKAEVDAIVAAALKEQGTALRAEFTTQLTTEVSKAQAAAKADADAQVAKAKAEAHRAQIKAKFETAVKAEALLPAKRESFYKFNRVDDDKSVVDIKLEDVDAYIEEFSDKAKLAAANKKQTKGSEVSVDPLEAKLSAAEVVAYRARKLCFERKQDPNNFAFINAATVEVLKGDKALGESYKRLEDAPAAA